MHALRGSSAQKGALELACAERRVRSANSIASYTRTCNDIYGEILMRHHVENPEGCQDEIRIEASFELNANNILHVK